MMNALKSGEKSSHDVLRFFKKTLIKNNYECI